jgi:hypothetical protein
VLESISRSELASSDQRPIFNFAPRGKLTPGAKLSPRGEFCPLRVKLSPGAKFSVCPSILLKIRECSPLGGVNVGVNIPPRGQISPLGARGEVKNGPLVA